MKKRLAVLVSSVLAGICISLGGAVFLSVENRVFGSALFTVGLFTICTFGLHLFTGKVCYVFERDASYAWDLPFIWLGNLCGTWLSAWVLRTTRAGVALAEKAMTLCQAKLADGLWSIFLLAMLCNILIYVAVEGYQKCPHEPGKYLALFFGVMVFILCGFEHCVANMFYFTLAAAWSGRTFLYLLVMTLGNAVGGVLFPVLRNIKN